MNRVAPVVDSVAKWWLLSAALGGGVLALEVALPSEIPVGWLYVLVVLAALGSPTPGHALIAALVASGLVGVAAIGSAVAGVPSRPVGERGVALALVWVTGLVISRHLRALDVLRTRAARTEQYLDVADVMILVLGTDQRVRLVNKRGAALLGYPADEIVGKNWFEHFLPPAAVDETRQVFDRVTRGDVKPVVRHENPILTRAGEERMISWHNVALEDSAGEIIGTLSSGEDVTEAREIGRRLDRRTRELEDLTYALDQACIVAVTDRAGTITYVNDTFCQISKYSRSELLGQNHRIINSGHHPKEFFRDLWSTIGEGRIWHGEIQNRAKDGSLYWVDTTIVPFLNEQGRPYQYMAIRSEITERKRVQALLQEQTALARLGQMAAIIAHEVRNPIAGIRGALQVLSSGMDPDGRDHAVVGTILGRLDSLNELVQDLLLFARPRTPRVGVVRVRGLLEETATLLRKDPVFSGIDVDVVGSDLVVRADPAQIQRVVHNLLLNAAQAMGGAGRIAVTLVDRGDECQIVVADTGPGIPAETRARVFEPFFTTRHRGSGLGLSIAKQVVEAHRGQLRLSSPPGGGTAVELMLPKM